MIDLTKPITIEVSGTITITPEGVTLEPTPVEPDPVEPTPEPVEPDPVEPDPVEPVTPADGLALEYIGGFRLRDWTMGVSRPAYSEGVIHVADDGLWIAGHTHDRAIGKYAIPEVVQSYDVQSLPIAENTEPFVRVEPQAWEPQARITGILQKADKVVATVQQFYDASQANEFDLAWINADGTQEGFFTLNGGAKAAGWMNVTPAEYVDQIGPYYMGSSSQLAINGRLSHGPSLYGWDGEVTTTPVMTFPIQNPMGAMGDEPAPGNELWNELSFAGTAFIHNGKYIAVGQTGGLRSGIGYKIRGSGGYISVEPDDTYNYFWIFDMVDILNATEVHEPRPEAYGVLDVPFLVSGAAWDGEFLYLCDKDGDPYQNGYERQPVVYKYRVLS